MLREILNQTGRLVAIGACLLWVSAGSVQAGPINPFNDRTPQVTIGSSGEPTLQSVLDGLWGGAVVDVTTDQQETGMWGFGSGAPPSISTLVVEYAGFAPTNIFGIWFGSDTTNLFRYDLLLGPASGPTDGASVTISGQNLTVASSGGVCGTDVNCGVAANALIDSTSFGFYLLVGSDYFYTVDQLNPGGTATALAFNRPGTETWAIGFEDAVSGDRDFQDMVVEIQSIQPVPEPGTLALIGMGLLGLGARRRNRRS